MCLHEKDTVVLRLKQFRERKEEIFTCRSYLPDKRTVKCKKGKEAHGH